MKEVTAEGQKALKMSVCHSAGLSLTQLGNKAKCSLQHPHLCLQAEGCRDALQATWEARGMFSSFWLILPGGASLRGKQLVLAGPQSPRLSR